MYKNTRNFASLFLIIVLADILFIDQIKAQSGDPGLTIIWNDTSLCNGAEVELIVVIDGIAPVSIIYEYNGVGGNANSSTDTISLVLADTGVFIITDYCDAVSGYIPTADTILIREYDSLGIFFSGGGFQCDAGQISPLVAHFSGFPPFILNCSINGSPTIIETSDSIYTFSTSGDIQVITQMISDLYCEMEVTDTGYYQVGDIPAPVIRGDSLACENVESIYSTHNDIYDVEWSIPGVSVYTIDSLADGYPITIDWTEPGEFVIHVKLVSIETGCESPESTMEISVYETPVSEDVSDTTCFGSNGPLQVEIPIEPGDDLYWPTLDYHGSSVSFEAAGNYPFMLTNEFGCMDTSALELINGCNFELFVPEAFTPNGDQINDYLELFGVYNAIEFTVYSPSGILLYQSTDIADFWDGTSDGKEVPEGSYYWSAIYYNNSNLEYRKTGIVTLIR